MRCASFDPPTQRVKLLLQADLLCSLLVTIPDCPKSHSSRVIRSPRFTLQPLHYPFPLSANYGIVKGEDFTLFVERQRLRMTNPLVSYTSGP